MGVDAEVVAAVEAHATKASRSMRCGIGAWRCPSSAFSRREPTLILELPGRDPIAGVHFTWVSNTNPWTYSNNRPMVTNPGCSFESGLGVFALTT